MRIRSFQHDTTEQGLIAILESGSLKSASVLGRTSSAEGEGKSFVYLTPWDSEEPHTKSGILLHFSPSLLESTKFFLNAGNAFGEGEGTPSGKSCKKCDWTYNTLRQIEGACVKTSLQEMEDVLVFDMGHCDGGPEVGIPGEIPLRPHLTKITMPPAVYERIKQRIPAEYVGDIQVMKGGRRPRRKTRRGKRSRLDTQRRK